MILDDALTRRIECAVAEERRRFAGGMATCHPDTKADWAAVGGGIAGFTGHGFFANFRLTHVHLATRRDGR